MATKKNLNEILTACTDKNGNIDLTKFEAEVADFLHEAGMTDREARQRIIAVSKYLASETNVDLQLAVARAYVSKRGDLDTTQTAEGFITQANAHVAKLESEKRTTGDYAGLNTKAIRTVLTNFAGALVDERYRESNAVLARENAGLKEEKARLMAALEIAQKRGDAAESTTSSSNAQLAEARRQSAINYNYYQNYAVIVKSVFEKFEPTMTEEQRKAYYVEKDGEMKLDLNKVVGDEKFISLIDTTISKSREYEIYADVVEKVFDKISYMMTAEEIAEYYEEFDGPDGKALRLNMQLVVTNEVIQSKVDEAILKAMKDLPRERKMRQFWTGVAAAAGIIGVGGTLGFGIRSAVLANENDQLKEDVKNLSDQYEKAEQEKAELQAVLDQILDKMGNYHEDLKGTFENEDGTYNINDILAVLDSDHVALATALDNFNNALSDYENASKFAQGIYDAISSVLTEEQKAQYFVEVTDENGNVSMEFDLESFMDDDELAGAIVSDYLVLSTLHEADDKFNDFMLELVGSDMSINSFVDESGNLDTEELRTAIDAAIDPYIAEAEAKLSEDEINYPVLSYVEKVNLKNEIQELKEQKEELFNIIVKVHEDFAELHGEKADLQAELDALKQVLESEGQKPEQNETAQPEQGAGSVSDATENGMQEDTTQSGGSGSENKGGSSESTGELGAN